MIRLRQHDPPAVRGAQTREQRRQRCRLGVGIALAVDEQRWNTNARRVQCTHLLRFAPPIDSHGITRRCGANIRLLHTDRRRLRRDEVLAGSLGSRARARRGRRFRHRITRLLQIVRKGIEDQRRELIRMPLRGEHHRRGSARVPQHGRAPFQWAARGNPIEHVAGIVGRAIGCEPPARVARRRTIAALVERIHRVPPRHQRIHQRYTHTRCVQIEVGERAPCPSVQQQDLSTRTAARRLRPYHERVCVVGVHDVLLQTGLRARGQRSRRDDEQREDEGRREPSQAVERNHH